MGISVGKDETAPGKFAYELWSDGDAIIDVVGGFATKAEAERAGMDANRAMLMPMVQAMFAQPEAEISLEELRAELAA